MKIAYFMPFKSMGHDNPSGDLIIGTEIFKFLKASGDNIHLASTLRCRWIYYRPLKLLRLCLERWRTTSYLRKSQPDLWLSYHCYYKAPDLLGPYCAKKLGIPYVIFQGIYSTKRRKKLTTLPGFLLNRSGLKKADHIFTNKRRDHQNLKRIIAPTKLTYIAPGIQPADFTFSVTKRNELRQSWDIQDETVIITAAMMRPGVKTTGLSIVIDCCSALVARGFNLKLIVVGDGECRKQLERQALGSLEKRSIFMGRIKREEMYALYSGADIFAFPGINESLGMVYLEAQACRLPVVAYEDWGASEAIVHEKTGLLSSSTKQTAFTKNLALLMDNSTLRQTMGQAGELHIRTNHDIRKNYDLLQDKLQEVAGFKKTRN